MYVEPEFFSINVKFKKLGLSAPLKFGFLCRD